MDPELKAAIEASNKDFHDFKELINKRDAELKSGNEARANELTGQINKINERFDAAEKAEQKRAADLKAAQDRADALEAKLNRLQLLGAGGREVDEKAAVERKNFFTFIRRGEKKMAAEEVKTLTQSDDTQGGVLSPTEYVREIIKGITLASPVRQLCRVRATGLRGISQPRRTGRSTAQWVAEIADRDESTNPSYGLEEIPTHELTAEHYVSFADLEDSVFDIEAELREEFSDQFGVAEGLAVVKGNGVGKPFGFINHTSLVASGAYTASGQAATIASAATNATAGAADKLIEFVHALPSAYAQNGKMALNRTTLGKIRQFKDTTGQFLWDRGVAGAIPPTILGHPYVEVPDMPDEAANAFPIAFGDFARAYVIVDRLSMSVIRDDLTRASKGQVKFVARRRVGGKVLLAEAIRLYKCAAS